MESSARFILYVCAYKVKVASANYKCMIFSHTCMRNVIKPISRHYSNFLQAIHLSSNHLRFWLILPHFCSRSMAAIGSCAVNGIVPSHCRIWYDRTISCVEILISADGPGLRRTMLLLPNRTTAGAARLLKLRHSFAYLIYECMDASHLSIYAQIR